MGHVVFSSFRYFLLCAIFITPRLISQLRLSRLVQFKEPSRCKRPRAARIWSLLYLTRHVGGWKWRFVHIFVFWSADSQYWQPKPNEFAHIILFVMCLIRLVRKPLNVCVIFHFNSSLMIPIVILIEKSSVWHQNTTHTDNSQSRMHILHRYLGTYRLCLGTR